MLPERASLSSRKGNVLQPRHLWALWLLARTVLTRGWSLEMGKKRRLKLSATSTACRGGGGSSSAPLAPPPPLLPPGPLPLRLLARLATAPSGATTVVAIFVSDGHHFRTETGTARRRGQKRRRTRNAKAEFREGGRRPGEQSAHASRPAGGLSNLQPGVERGRREFDLLKHRGWVPGTADWICKDSRPSFVQEPADVLVE